MRLPPRQALAGLQRLTSAARLSTRLPTSQRALLPSSYRSYRFSSSSSPSQPDSKPPPPPQAPQAIVDAKYIRENADLYADNCTRRNYASMAAYPARMVALHDQWKAIQIESRTLREDANTVRKQITHPAEGESREALLERARVLKQQLATVKADESRLTAEIQQLAAALPNLTSAETPDTEQDILSYFNCDGESPHGRPANDTGSDYYTSASLMQTPDLWRSHVHIGAELGLMDFSAASNASGWGWYYLLGDGARLEQALVQYALNVVHRHGWQLVSPPSIVRSGIAAACGFQPRDQGGEQQTYSLEGMPLSLTATAEIPLAALYADSTIEATSDKGLPLRRAAVSRCYRAEAGARGANTKGLYRVHEFTKVELFAWTEPDLDVATEMFDELVDIQTEILSSLGLPCRVLEMPATDLGASAYRKIDIEAFFPGRCRPKGSQSTAAAGNSPADFDYATGWGEVSSASICTDYQSRRLATRAKINGGPLTFPWTLNGTALAVPRVLAAILENGWNEETKSVTIPECLQPWMDGQETIEASK